MPSMPTTRSSPAIESMDDAIVETLRRKTAVECVAMIGDSNQTARILSAAGVKYLHPDWSADEIRAEVARRMLGDAG